MDKRWIGIIIILIIGLGCMYLIVMSSTTVGNAVSVIEDVTITIPPGYINSEDGGSFCVLHNKATNETIRIKCLDDGKNSTQKYEGQLKTLKEQYDITIDNNFTNKTLSMIEYENASSADNSNITLVYFDKCNHTFSMKMEHFTDSESKENAISFIIDTLKYDFKQKN